MNMKLRELSGAFFIILVILMTTYLVISPRVSETFVDAGRCGVDLPPCLGKDIRCINGYCKSDMQPRIPELSNLPITPPTKYPYV